jgi:SAM-dependent methyltransferase
VQSTQLAAPAGASPVLTFGNAAKLYCLDRIDQLASERDELKIVDLGAGEGRNFVRLLERHRHVSYVAVEPSRAACATARQVLPEKQATVVQARAYAGEYGPADVVVSFSAFEHVYRRDVYTRMIAKTLAPGGLAFVNYDSGHFRSPILRDRIKNSFGPTLARIGYESWYQSFVPEDEFRALVDDAGLVVHEALSFNTEAKGIYRLIPPEGREEYMRGWLEFELMINRVAPLYDDRNSSTFHTRNFVLGLDER